MLDQKKDLQLLFQRYLNKASKGSKNATMYIADCFLYGWGTEINLDQYRKYLNQAALMGVDIACERLFFEALANQNDSEIKRIFEIWGKNAEANGISTYKKIKEKYNDLPQKDTPNMIDALEKGKEEEHRQLAIFYQFGFGVKKDYNKVIEYLDDYLARYENGFVAANILGIYDLGKISEKQLGENIIKVAYGIGVLDTFESDYNPIGYLERLLLFAACNGNVESQIQMAHLYLGEDLGLLRSNEYADDIEAMKWLIVSLENGGDGDNHNVSPTLMLLADKLREKNDNQNAFKAWDALAKEGFVLAIRIVGSFYFDGEGGDKDIRKAAQFWLKAAQNGDETAINNVNIITEAGNGDFEAGINVLIAEDEARSNTSGVYSSSSSREQTQSSGGCYVATCVYGSYDCPEVWTLRRYRDYYLSKSWYGRLFIKIYYSISPIMVKLFGKYTLFKKIWRVLLDKIVNKLRNNGYKSTRYNDKN